MKTDDANKRGENEQLQNIAEKYKKNGTLHPPGCTARAFERNSKSDQPTDKTRKII
jgi:hypothetical protein